MQGEQAKITLLYTSDYRKYFCTVHYSFSGALPVVWVFCWLWNKLCYRYWS